MNTCDENAASGYAMCIKRLIHPALTLPSCSHNYYVTIWLLRPVLIYHGGKVPFFFSPFPTIYPLGRNIKIFDRGHPLTKLNRKKMEESRSVSHAKYGSLPILRLHKDILGHIFSLNADMEQRTEENVPALLTLRYTSQVCSGWRDLTIGSPLLWARVINLQLLKQTGAEWRIEVIRRTGAAPLHIKSIDNEVRNSTVIQGILNKHWGRIQSLDLHFNFRGVDDTLRSLFRRPAPCLEVFRFVCPHWPLDRDEPNLIPSDFALFANDAPLLRTLSASTLTHHLGTLAAPNLRDLQVHPSISTSDLLSALSCMPLLERLEAAVYTPPALLRDENVLPSLPQVSLPRLTEVHFSIRHALDTTLSFLAHINPANTCALDVVGAYDTYRQEVPNHRSVALYSDILSRYSRYNTELSIATNLHAIYENDCTSLLVKFPFHRSFRFKILSRKGFPEATVSTFLNSFTGLRVDNIRELALSIDPTEPMLSNTDIRKFILALVSVETLTTNATTLGFIQKIQSDTRILAIPALKHINLDSIDRQAHISSVLDYVNWRMKYSGLVDALSLTIIRHEAGLDISALSQISGLTLEPLPGS